ncbi:hypothetical protein VKT23_008636 [Stygiomarasmius scandens]|uniref:Uncharacterized protein n=1 Tax=Marasmiellus scandens TaxID=2682957 RepID=A0ABR1JJJ0_9AGAR
MSSQTLPSTAQNINPHPDPPLTVTFTTSSPPPVSSVASTVPTTTTVSPRPDTHSSIHGSVSAAFAENTMEAPIAPVLSTLTTSITNENTENDPPFVASVSGKPSLSSWP